MPAQDPLDYLFSLEKLGMKFGLENMRHLCAALGQPQEAFTSVIVAGTNGKGSVTAMTEAALRAAGHRSARYTSPHLVRLEERFLIDGQEVATGALRDAAARVQGAAEQLVTSGTLDAPPTFFECTTAIAFELFRDSRTELAILEVGLGGRLDATNVVTAVAGAITSIDLDHEAQLGPTLVSIAREKAGIIKRGMPIVCGPLAPEADRVIEDTCIERHARLVRSADAVRMQQLERHAGTVSVTTPRRSFETGLALEGRHQMQNAAVAIALLEELDGLGWKVTDGGMREGIGGAVWPGRLERFSSGGVEILLDAAHNPAGARALAAHLRDIGWSGITLVFGAMHDKDARGMIEALAPLCSSIVCTTPATPRARPAAELARLAREAPGGAVVQIVDPPEAALSGAIARERPIVVAGSMFLIGPLRAILR